MNDLISRQALYERTTTLEAQALDYVGRLIERDGDEPSVEWKIWSAILTERTAFKHDVYDAPPAQQWHTEPPEESGFYIVCTNLGEVGECVYMDNGEWDTDRNYRFPMWCQIVAWMPMPKPYKGES